MFYLVLITLALIVVSWLFMFMLVRGFVRGVSWFDERSEQRQRERAQAYARYLSQQKTRADASKEDEEWAEYIDVN